jgi:hypothetical protein
MIVAAMAATFALTMRALVRANRVATGRRSSAPLSWLASLAAPARLHRRLRRAMGVAEVAVGSVAPAALVLGDVAGELVERAVTLDHWLVAANGLYPVARRDRMVELSREVREIEVSAARLHQLSCDWRRSLDHATASGDTSLPDWHQRLDAVEAALRDLRTGSALPIEAKLIR